MDNDKVNSDIHEAYKAFQKFMENDENIQKAIFVLAAYTLNNNLQPSVVLQEFIIYARDKYDKTILNPDFIKACDLVNNLFDLIGGVNKNEAGT